LEITCRAKALSTEEKSNPPRPPSYPHARDSLGVGAERLVYCGGIEGTAARDRVANTASTPLAVTSGSYIRRPWLTRCVARRCNWWCADSVPVGDRIGKHEGVGVRGETGRARERVDPLKKPRQNPGGSRLQSNCWLGSADESQA
jgi:hypothetical protein